jgi:Fe-S-cluster containining protein
MKVPVVARNSFQKLQHKVEFIAIVNFVIEHLKKLKKTNQRARFIHEVVDEHNAEVFAHPLVQQLSPCKMGCVGCCHTQVSVTKDEAELLSEKILNGLEINRERLKLQAAVGNNSDAYFKIPYQERRCVFLSDQDLCMVYEDRPSVCRTNAVLGSADQCDTSVSIKPTRLVLTEKADMAIYASFLASERNGTLPQLVQEVLTKKKA